MNNTITIEKIDLPFFDGYYNSLIDGLIDNYIENEIEHQINDYNENNTDKLDNDDFDYDIDYN